VDADLVTPKVSKIGEPLKFAVDVKPFGSGIGERLDIPCKAYVGDEDYGARVGQSRIIPIGSDLHPEFILVSVVEVPEA
jgi:acetoin utilization deacetylase AcuC-like enzyme